MNCKECGKDIDENRYCQFCGLEQYSVMRSLQEVKDFETDMDAFMDTAHDDIMKQIMINRKIDSPEGLLELTESIRFVISTMKVTLDWVKGSTSNPLDIIKKKHASAMATFFNE